MRSRNIGLAGAALALILAVGGPAGAAAVFDNLSASSNGTDPAGSLGPLAESFTTGAGSFQLSDVKLLLGGSAAGADVRVSVTDDSSGNPGAEIVTTGNISDSFLTGALSVADFSLSTNLAANTRYWVRLSTPNGDPVSWSWSLDASGVGVGGGFFTNSNGRFPNANGPYQMQVSGSGFIGVPETSTWVTLVLGFAGLGAMVRGRRKASASAMTCP